MAHPVHGCGTNLLAAIDCQRSHFEQLGLAAPLLRVSNLLTTVT